MSREFVERKTLGVGTNVKSVTHNAHFTLRPVLKIGIIPRVRAAMHDLKRGDLRNVKHVMHTHDGTRRRYARQVIDRKVAERMRRRGSGKNRRKQCETNRKDSGLSHHPYNAANG